MHIDLYAMRRLARGLRDVASDATSRAQALDTNDQRRTPHLTLASSCLTAATALLDVADALEPQEKVRNGG